MCKSVSISSVCSFEGCGSLLLQSAEINYVKSLSKINAMQDVCQHKALSSYTSFLVGDMSIQSVSYLTEPELCMI